MRYSITKNWIATFDILKKRPIIAMPFFMIAFLEGLALEIVYFSTRSPISYVAKPIIRKFFGEPYLHYPASLIIAPNLFYYLQIFIYIMAGVALTAISVNIFKNIKESLPVKANAVVRNALHRYMSFFVYAAMVVVLILFVRKIEIFVFSKIFHFLLKIMPPALKQLYSPLLTLMLFLTNILIQIFLILTIPVLVIEKLSLLKSITRSVYLGFRNFSVIFGLIFLPFLAYFPLTFFKSTPFTMAAKTFPEMSVLITAVGIVVSIFLDCFIMIAVSQWLIDNKR